MKKAIYTAIFGNYDRLKHPSYVNPDYNYILFTDRETYIAQKLGHNESIWSFEIIENVEEKGGAYHVSKDIKLNPHKYLHGYDMSIYIDGSIEQIGDIERFLEYFDDCYLMCKHPQRTCLYDESEVLIKQKVGNLHRLDIQRKRYREEGYPPNNGLLMGGIIARMHNEDAIKINNLWWEEVQKGTMRDQISIPYVSWKLGIPIDTVYYEGEIDQVFRIHRHYKKR